MHARGRVNRRWWNSRGQCFSVALPDGTWSTSEQAPSRAPVDFSFAAGTGLVGHCVSTCLPCQLEHPPAYPPYASPLSSSGVRHEAMHVTDGGGSVGTREMGLGKAVDLVGPADFYGILVGEGTPLASPGGEAGVESRAFVRRSRLAYFPPNIDDDRDESPSHPSSPLRDSLRAPAKARGQGHRGRSQSPSRSLIRHRAGPRAREGASGAVQRVNVVCVPVCGGSSADGDIGCGRVMMGVLKVSYLRVSLYSGLVDSDPSGKGCL